MKLFLQHCASRVTGVLSGFDRLVLHGSLRLFSYPQGLLKYLCHHRILLKDFGRHSRELSERVIARSLADVEKAGRPVVYLPSSQDRKEDIARQIAARDKVQQGSICVLKTVELCRSYEVGADRQTQRIELRSRQRKCLHLYHYMIHPVFGFMHVRLPGDVLRFFGRRVKSDGSPWGNFPGEISSDVKTRAEGVRIKHRSNGNSLKIYDKGSVLRFETTLYQPRDLRVFRKPEGQPKARPRWMPLRHSLADLRRRAQVSQASNERLMDAQAAVETPQTLEQLTASLTRPVTTPGRSQPDGGRTAPRRFRALQPFAEKDLHLLQAVSRPEFNQNGFRNRDLRPLLFGCEPRDAAEQKRQSAAVSRQFALLRAHALIRKVPHTHRYVLTDQGRLEIAALLAARNANALELAKLAA